METEGKKIVTTKMDTKRLLKTLNKAFADEWLAYYQYWIGAKVIQGPMRPTSVSELIEHASDELRHANMIVERIIQLDGTPILEPKIWYDMTSCGYLAPTEKHTKKILQQNIQGEQCAIKIYNKILEMVKEKDPITYQMIYEILADEVKHEKDLQNILKDLET